MKSVRKYEGIFIYPPDEGPGASKEEEKRLDEIIHRFGGRALDHKDWGHRQLGYVIRKVREARILLCNFEMETQQLGEFRKAVELDEKILKSTIVRQPEPKSVREKSKKAPRPHKEAVHKDTVKESREGVRARQS